MRLDIQEGSYIVAVSGGVDSVVLLNLLVKSNNSSKKSELIVAHFDHGIRTESGKDRVFTEQLAKSYNLPFIYGKASLGPSASEETARLARYNFLNNTLKENHAQAIITAHHQDDLIETAAHNIIRGSGRRGLTSLKSRDKLLRPLLNYSKADIIKYAKDNQLQWREDSTNNDKKYLRNYIRHEVLPKLDPKYKQQLLSILKRQGNINNQIDELVGEILNQQLSNNDLPRLWFNSLDNMLSKEIIVAWLRRSGIYGYDRKSLQRLSSSLKIAKENSLINVSSGYNIRVSKDYLALEPIER